MISKSPSIPVGTPKITYRYSTLCFCKVILVKLQLVFVKLQSIFVSGCKRAAELSPRHHLPSEGSPLRNTEKFWRWKKSCHRFVWPDDGKNHRDENRTSQWSGQVHLSVFDDSNVYFTGTYFQEAKLVLSVTYMYIHCMYLELRNVKLTIHVDS